MERLLIKGLAYGMPDTSQDQETEIEKSSLLIFYIQDCAKLHLGMLTISLITCLAYGCYVFYTYRTEKNELLPYIRNLMAAFIGRIFFSIILDAIIIGDNLSSGLNALLAFECICQNLVFAYWLLLTLYIHERVQNNFNSEPTLTQYQYIIPGVAVFFALIWIFVAEAEISNFFWGWYLYSLHQWTVASLRLLYLFIQLAAVINMGRMAMKLSLCNDSISLLRKSAAMLAVLIFLFWLQFGLNLGRWGKSESYQNFDFFIDGSHGALVSLILFFFYKWVSTLLSKLPKINNTIEEGLVRTVEAFVNEGQSIFTIDRFIKEKISGRRQNLDEADESKDVVYSSVVEPHRLQKTLELYKRLNILPGMTTFEGDDFYDCLTRVSDTGDSEKTNFQSIASEDNKPQPQLGNATSEKKSIENVRKKNAFYESKYLILEPKKNKNIPKYLETTPSVSSSTGKTSSKDYEKELERNFFFNFGSLSSDEIVKKWLNTEHLERTSKNGESITTSTEKDTNSENERTSSTSTISNQDTDKESDKNLTVKTQIKADTSSEENKKEEYSNEIVIIERQAKRITDENTFEELSSNEKTELKEIKPKLLNNEMKLPQELEPPKDDFKPFEKEIIVPKMDDSSEENVKTIEEDASDDKHETISRPVVEIPSEEFKINSNYDPPKERENSTAFQQNSETVKVSDTSDSEFSCERSTSRSTSCTIDEYYARLINTDQEVMKKSHPFMSARGFRNKF